MLSECGINGSDLPEKTVCLTFDDGPAFPVLSDAGPRSLQVGVHLAERGAQATFFVLGEQLARTGELALRLAHLGHNLANHTWSHPSLLTCDSQTAFKQIEKTDQLLRPLPATLQLLRPPFGDWSPAVADAVNATPMRKYIGPVMWDIDGEDWRSWHRDESPRSCVSKYTTLLAAHGRGILLLHDNSAEPELAAKNRTFEAVKLLLAWLGANGFTVVPLREAPQVRAALDAAAVERVPAPQQSMAAGAGILDGRGKNLDADA